MSEPTGVTLRPHHAYQSWTTDWYGPDYKDDGTLRRHTKRFGKEGEVTAMQARRAFRRWLEDVWQPRYNRKAGEIANGYLIESLAKDYYAHAQKIYRKNGEETSHVGQVKRAMEQLSDAYGTSVPTR
jgi:hypothetical protein